jgi:hypothetical protein
VVNKWRKSQHLFSNGLGSSTGNEKRAHFSHTVVLEKGIIRMFKPVEFGLSEIKMYDTANVSPSLLNKLK